MVTESNRGHRGLQCVHARRGHLSHSPRAGEESSVPSTERIRSAGALEDDVYVHVVKKETPKEDEEL